MQKIFCVEDDENIRELVVYALKSSDFDAEGFENAADFWKAIDRSHPQLILLDIMLPDEDGLSILKKLRASCETKSIPVIMLTAKASEYDKVIGLDIGADDYITKPFGVMELMSRVKAVLRRVTPPKDEMLFSYKNIILDSAKHIVTVDKQTITLTYKEFELLKYLLLNKGIVLTRDAIMSAVWGFDFEGESRTVDMHIKTLRKKLCDGGEYVQTIRGVGYKMGE